MRKRRSKGEGTTSKFRFRLKMALAEENKQNIQCWNGPRQVYDQTFLYNYL